jgi:hypothetical protein
MTTRNIESLISELDSRIENDYKRMRHWRYFHRVVGLLATAILLVVPPILAIGFVSASSAVGKTLLFTITVVGGFNGLFQPLIQSYRRRSDANNVLSLLDEFRTGVALCREKQGPLAELYETFSARFTKLYAERGESLIEATIQSKEKGKGQRKAPPHGH